MSGGRHKRSVSLYGHRTSVALEPEFWAVVDDIAAQQSISLAGLIKQIDDLRLEQESELGLAAYLRVWALETVKSKSL